MRQLAQTLGAPGARNGRMRIVTVVSVTAATATDPAAVTVRVGGSTLDVPGVRYLASYTPAAGDTAVAWHDDNTLIVLDRLA